LQRRINFTKSNKELKKKTTLARYRRINRLDYMRKTRDDMRQLQLGNKILKHEARNQSINN